MNRFQILDTTPVEIQKFFTVEYWTTSVNSLTPVVNSFSYHFWLYLAMIACLVFIGFAFRFYKGLFLDKATLDNLAEFNDPKNPIYARLTFFENYFLVAAYLTAFFFLARQSATSILSNRLFILGIFIFIFVGIILAVKYFLTDKKLEEEFFKAKHKLNY
jgi:hypothetical protein